MYAQNRSVRRNWLLLACTLTVLLLAALVTSCGGNNDQTAGSTAATGTTPTSERVLVSGTGSTCEWTTGPDLAKSKWEKAVTYVGRFACDDTLSDPRVTGHLEYTQTLVKITDPDMDYFLAEDATLTTEGGTWRGDGYGSEYWTEDGSLFTSGHATLIGEGAYDGLVYHYLFARDSGESDDYLYVGFIEPVD